MKKYVLEILKSAEETEKNGSVSQKDIECFERHILYCQHERLVHLIVTVGFAVMTLMCLGIMLAFMSIGTLLLFVLFAVMTAAYIGHYYFLENSVQKMYIIMDKIKSRTV